MTTTAFRGVIPPVLTPLDESGAFDEAAFERLVERLITAGVHGLFVLGSSGEVAFLSDDERTRVLEASVRISAGRVPVIAGVNEMTPARVIGQVRLAEAAGVDAIVATAVLRASERRRDRGALPRHRRRDGPAALRLRRARARALEARPRDARASRRRGSARRASRTRAATTSRSAAS